MTVSSNQIYADPEGYALEILKQKLAMEAQKAAQQSMIEYTAMRSFLGQGQMVYCIPCGGGSVDNSAPTPPIRHPISNWQPCQCPMPMSIQQTPISSIPLKPAQTTQQTTQPVIQTRPPQQQQPPPPPVQPSSIPQPPMQQSTLVINFRNVPQNPTTIAPGTDDCSLGPHSIEVVIDIKYYLPAEVNLNVEEKMIEIRIDHADGRGTKTFSRRYDLPACIAVELTKCFLSHDGVLYLSAPWQVME